MANRNPVDKSVGERLKQRRREIGLSQAKLGAELELTAQQILKYERGSNRIGAGLLLEVARTLRVPVRYFFQDADRPAIAAANMPAIRNLDALIGFVHSAEGRELCAAFTRIADAATRTSVVQLIQALGEDLPVGD
jgi:transcriptional regulator with XRE-family HTH domain